MSAGETVAETPLVAPVETAPVQLIESTPLAAPAAAQPVVPAEPAPAPADPNALNPDAPRNYRIQAQDAIEQRTLQLRAHDRTLTLPRALELAYSELGLPAPFAQPAAPAAPAATAPEPAPQAAVDPLAQINADIEAIQAEMEDLNSALEPNEWRKANNDLMRLTREAARLEVQQTMQTQFEQQTANQTLQQLETALHSEYSVLADATHPFTIAFNAQREQLYRTGTDEQLGDPNLEINLARQLEQQFSGHGMAVRTQSPSPAATTPQAQTPPVTQPTAPPAVAPTPAAQPRSAAAPLSGAPASVSPVTGITPPNPQEKFQSLLSSPGSMNADEAADAMLSGFFGGSAPTYPQGRLVAA